MDDIIQEHEASLLQLDKVSRLFSIYSLVPICNLCHLFRMIAMKVYGALYHVRCDGKASGSGWVSRRCFLPSMCYKQNW